MNVTWSAEDLAADGPPEEEFHKGVAARQPRHRLAAGILCRDSVGNLLMVEPVYKPTWELPGGMIEQDETPFDACRREVREELGVDLPIGRLLVVDWVPRHGVWSDMINFIFDGSVIADPPAFTLQADELSAAKYVSLDEAASHVRPSMARRLRAAVEAADSGSTAYLHLGRPVSAG